MALPDEYCLRLAELHSEGEQRLVQVLSVALQESWTADLVRERLTRVRDLKALYAVSWHQSIVATASSRWMPDRFPEADYVHWVATHPDRRAGLGRRLNHRPVGDIGPTSVP